MSFFLPKNVHYTSETWSMKIRFSGPNRKATIVHSDKLSNKNAM